MVAGSWWAVGTDLPQFIQRAPDGFLGRVQGESDYMTTALFGMYMAVKVILWKDAYWLDVVYKGQRKRKRVGTGKTGKKAAELAAIKIAAQLADGNASVFALPAPADAHVPTFEAVAVERLQKYQALHSIRPTTLENYRFFTNRHLIPYFGSKPITALTTTSIEDFIEAKRGPSGSIRFQGKALSDSSLRTGLLALRLILQRAVRTRLIVANPMSEVEWRGQPHIEQVDPFTDAELRSILQAAPPDMATLLRLWAQAGMRAGEVCGLQWQDLDLELGQILVRRTWSRQRLGPTKTGRGRIVSFLHPVVEAIADWRPEPVKRGLCWLVCGASRSSPGNLPPLSSGAVRHLCRQWNCTGSGSGPCWLPACVIAPRSN